MINIGILGFGRWSQKIANVLMNFKKLRIHSIYSRTWKKTMNAFISKGYFYDNWKKMIDENEKKIDALLVILPPEYNLDLIKYCKKKKIPIFFEKPIAKNASKAKKILFYARNSLNKIYHVNYIDIHNKKLKKIIKSKFIKNIKEVNCILTGKNIKKYLDPLLEYAPHFLAIIILIFGNKKIKLIYVRKVKNKNLYYYIIKFKVDGKININMLVGKNDFSKREIIFSYSTKKKKDYYRPKKILKNYKDLNDNSFYYSLRSFLNKINNEKKNISDIELSYKVSILIEKIKKFKK